LAWWINWMVQISGLLAGTAGTGRVHPRRAAGMADTSRRVFFSNPYPTRLITVPVAGTRVRGYSGTGRRVRVREFLNFFFFCCFFFQRVRGSAGTGIDLMWTEGGNFEIWISRVRGRGYGRRVRGLGYNGFFPKKTWPALLKPVPVYPFTRLYPGTGTGTEHE
jgi:hypothetical protein